MRHIPIFFALLLGFFDASLSSALETDGIFWNQFFWQGPQPWKVRPFMEIQQRMGGDISRIEHLLYRPAIMYAVDEDISLWLGYGWTPLFDVANSSFQSEQRFWQQYAHSFHLNDRMSLSTRTRLEERFIPEATGTGWRARELIRFHYAFDDAKKWQLAIWDELFWQLNAISPSVIEGFNQNRIFIGSFIEVYENLNLEIGYLSVLTRQAAPLDPLKLSHGLLFGVYTRLP